MSPLRRRSAAYTVLAYAVLLSSLTVAFAGLIVGGSHTPAHADAVCDYYRHKYGPG